MSLYVENSRDSKDKVDLSDMTNSSSLVDVFTAAISGNSIDSMSLVFMDDLAISLKVSDCGKLVKAQQALADARRDYADEKTIENEQLYQKLLLDRLEVNKGMFVENIVAQMFKAAGHKLAEEKKPVVKAAAPAKKTTVKKTRK